MTVTLNDVRNEIDGYLPAFSNDGDFNDIARVALFLANGATDARFLQALRGLEQAMEARLEARVTPPGWQIWKPQPDMAQEIQTARDYWPARQAGGGKNEIYTHLLSEELTAVEALEGFDFHNANARKAQYYVSVITPDDFRAQLRLGRHWKDPGVPGSHGEFTHRIQWYLVCRSGILGAVGRAVEIFRILGIAGIPLNPAVNGATETDLWQLVCDRDRFGGAQNIAPKAASILDFRCPEHFNEYLTNRISYAHYPLLRSFLVARAQKRNGIDLLDYVAKKAYQQPYVGLTNQRKYRVLRALGERDQLCVLRYGNAYAGLGPPQRLAVDNFFNAATVPTGILRR